MAGRVLSPESSVLSRGDGCGLARNILGAVVILHVDFAAPLEASPPLEESKP